MGELRGRHVFAPSIVGSSASILKEYAQHGHEGLTLLLGVRDSSASHYLSVAAPKTLHGPRSVLFDAQSFGAVVRSCREHNLAVLAQLHSHPGDDARHSDGDDELIPLPFEGMLSLVVPRYGAGLEVLEDFVVHQFQDGHWVHTPDATLHALPTLLDLRHG